jgi:hypothetical protein
MATAACDRVGVLNSGGDGSTANPWQLTVLPNDQCPVKLQFFGYSRVASLTPYPQLSQAEDHVIVDEHASVRVWQVVLYVILGVLGAALVLVGTFLGRRVLGRA